MRPSQGHRSRSLPLSVRNRYDHAGRWLKIRPQKPDYRWNTWRCERSAGAMPRRGGICGRYRGGILVVSKGNICVGARRYRFVLHPVPRRTITQYTLVQAVASYNAYANGNIDQCYGANIQVSTGATVQWCTYNYAFIDSGQTLAVNFSCTIYLPANALSAACEFYAEFWADGSGHIGGGGPIA